MINSDLIYDLGVNYGEDTGFYLEKGFRVIGVEANPIIYAALKERFSREIARGRLILLNVGIAGEAGVSNFYVNEDNDHWSSFVEAYGTRDGTRYHVVEVECITILELMRRFGAPYYMKIDIEGMDQVVLGQLGSASAKPEFISVEEYGVKAIDDLHRLGFKSFKLMPQSNKSWAVPPNPPLEGSFVERKFNGRDTGLFGKELPGDWEPYEDFRSRFISQIRAENYSYVGPPNEWFDIHARS